MKFPVCVSAFLILSACLPTSHRPTKPVEPEIQEIACLDVLEALRAKLNYIGSDDLQVRASALPAVLDQETGDEIQSEWYNDASFSYPEFCERMSERLVVNSLTGVELDLTYYIVIP